MNNQEYIQDLIKRFNADPMDTSFTDVEKTLLVKLAEAEKKVSAVQQQIAELEKEVNTKTQTMMELRGAAMKEKVRSDAFVETLLALRVQ